MSHPLARFLKDHPEITQADVARGGRTSPARVSDVLAGRLRRFSPEVCRAMAKYLATVADRASTEDAPSMEQLLFARPAQPRRHRRQAS